MEGKMSSPKETRDRRKRLVQRLPLLVWQILVV